MSFAQRGSSLQQQKKQIDAIYERHRANSSPVRPPLTSAEIKAERIDNLAVSLQQMPFEDLYELTTCCENEIMARRLKRRVNDIEKQMHHCGNSSSSCVRGTEISTDEPASIVSDGASSLPSESESSPHHRQQKTIAIDVGGTRFVTAVETLCREEGSLFTAWFAGLRDLKKEDLFFDRSPALFALILDYLRGDDTVVEDRNKLELKRLKREAEFFSLTRLRELVDARIQEIEKESHASSSSLTANGVPTAAQT